VSTLLESAQEVEISLCFDSRCDAAWDSFLAAHPAGHHEQSSRFAAERQRFGYSCDRIIAHRGGSIVGGAQVLVRGTRLGRSAHVQRGPLALADDAGVLRQITATFESLARKRNYRSVRIDSFLEATHVRAALEDSGFATSMAWGGNSCSERIPLAMADSQLIERMHYNVRRYLSRLLDDANIEVRHGTAETIEDFYFLLEKTASHQQFPIFPRSYFEYLHAMFGRRAPHFLAYHGGQPVAGVFNPIVAHTMYYGWGGIDRSTIAAKRPINLLLHFRVAQWARAAGCRYYDLAGTSQFKRQLGIEQVLWPPPYRRFFGRGARLHRAVLETSWSNATLRTRLKAIHARLGFAKRVPM
jgi:peptidoglycan pentaglycine glycine transferase (the first glycine)